jgi:hypothetical protein
MIIDEYLEPAVLTGFVRTLPAPLNLALNGVLPDKTIGDIEAAMDQVTRTNRAAKFRAWDSETPVSQRDRFQRNKVKLPPLGVKLPIGEYERLVLERARTGGDNRAAYVGEIYNDAAQLTREVYNRMELARGDVLTDGKFTLTGEMGLKLEADFGLDSSHNVAAATLWTNHASADPITDLKNWTDLYRDDAGEDAGRILTSKTVLNNLLQCDAIKALFYRGDMISGSPNLITPAQLNQVLVAYGYPAIETYDAKIDVDGVSTRPIAADKLLLLPANAADLGYTAWGITAEARTRACCSISCPASSASCSRRATR